MPLTAADVHNVTFSKPPIGKRGYHEDEVDTFLDLVASELARLVEERNDLRNQVEHLNRRLRTAPVNTDRNLGPLAPPQSTMAAVSPLRTQQTSPGDYHHSQSAKVLGLAQQIADRLTGEAKAEADGMVRQARTNAQQLLSDATAKADGIVSEARTRAETMLHDACTKAETLDRHSREQAASLERAAARKHSEIIGSISQEKSALEKRIDELHTFEREYHTRLKGYLEAQLAALGESRSAAADPYNQQGFGAHHSDRRTRDGASGRGISNESGKSGIPGQPAVELGRVKIRDVMEPTPPIERSVS
jgi:DivIVA domain-containing protein